MFKRPQSRLWFPFTGPFRSPLLATLLAVLLCASPSYAERVSIRVTNADATAPPGRLLLAFNRSAEIEPRFYDDWPVAGVQPIFATDVEAWPAGEEREFGEGLAGFPLDSLDELGPGIWYVQALLDSNVIDADINAPGNSYSEVREVVIPGKGEVGLELSLQHTVPAEELPPSSEFLKYVKFRSPALSDFWGKDMYLRAAVLLPNSYYSQPERYYPVNYDVGGLRFRYTRVQELMARPEFTDYWSAPETPQLVTVFLDGEGPFGDSYQIDSANNGPYGVAVWDELLPYLEENFRITPRVEGRFISGCSTGGWVSLALQLFKPDFFNGAWSFSADGVDFRAFQLVDIYADDNAFVNQYGTERPSSRDTDGEVRFSIATEVAMERVLGRGETYRTSSGQWGVWNALYSPRGKDGLPQAIWDDEGNIDHEVAEAWKKYDLRLYTEENWAELGPGLAGKLHIYMGGMDEYYLNNAMVLFEGMLKSRTDPVSDARFIWAPREGHCAYDHVAMRKRSDAEMLERWRASQSVTQ